MRKIIILFLFILVLLSVSTVVFADGEITREDVLESMKYCEEFPVKLTLDGEEIVFEENDDIPPIIVRDRTLIPARALFESMGGIVFWDEERQEVEIQLGDSYVVLGIDSTEAWVNDEAQTLEVPAIIVAREGEYYGRTMIPLRFVAESLGCFVDWNELEREVIIISPKDPEGDKDGQNTGEQPEITSGAAISFWDPFIYEPLEMMNENAAQKLIALDLGHGGSDVGAIGHEHKKDELYEKTVNLKVGLYLRDYLREAGASVYMIREKDVYVGLIERTEAANNRGADLYVAIHNNSSNFDWPMGTEVHYYNKVDDEERDEMQLYGIYSEDVAESVQKEMLKALGTFDRGVKNSPRLIVLNRTVMPAIVIEGAFLSNEEDFEMIKTDEYAKRYAYATAKGLISVMNKIYEVTYEEI